MKANKLFSIFTLAIIYLSQVDSAKVVLSGIEQLTLNAKREDRVWYATGTNGTQGMLILGKSNWISSHSFINQRLACQLKCQEGFSQI